ncbi:MAG: proton-conducting membrane transporter [Clostridiales bacterium]|nr:proton-conducting membrane transporter [Clostridiales bacterium]
MLLVSILIPLVGAALLFLLRPANAKLRNAIVMAASLLTSGCAAWCLFTPGDHAMVLLRLSDLLTVSFRLDDLGRVFAGLVAFLWPLASLYGLEYMKHEGGENHFFGFYLISYAVTLGIAFSEDLMSLYVFYELLTLATLPLVMHGMKAKNVHAGRTYAYYCLGGAAMGFMALVTVIHYSGAGNFTPGGIAALVAAPEGTVLAMYVLGFFGFGVKAAVLPFHRWLPDAGVAPTPVTALLHAVAVVKAGVFAVARLTYYSFGAELLRGTWAQTLCLCVALASILFGSCMAVREQHMKRRLAYSTMSNLSYVLFGVLLMTPAGLAAGLTHMVYHGLMKIALFCCVGAIMIYTGRSDIRQMRGLAKVMPVTSAVFLVCSAALVGVPPLLGFSSKWALATAGVAAGNWMGVAGAAVLLISAVLTAVYVLVPALSAYALPLSGDVPAENCDPGWRIKTAVCVVLLAVVVLSFASRPLARFLAEVAAGAC